MSFFWDKYREARDTRSYWAAYAFITPVTGIGDLVVRLAYFLISGKITRVDWLEFSAYFLFRTLFDGLWLAFLLHWSWQDENKAESNTAKAKEPGEPLR